MWQSYLVLVGGSALFQLWLFIVAPTLGGIIASSDEKLRVARIAIPTPGKGYAMRLRWLAFCISLIMFALAIGLPLLGQEAEEEKPEYGWRNALVGSLNFIQTSFDNWSQGGENASAWQLNLNGKAANKAQKYKWDNSGKIAYGRTKIQGIESRKSVDEIRAESVFTYLLGVYVNPYVAASGETQFTAGYDYDQEPKVEVSNFLDPGYFTQSVGVGYEPVEEFRTRLGFAVKETVTMDHNAPYADDPDTD